MQKLARELGEAVRWVGERLQRLEWWQVAALVVIMFVALPVVPFLLLALVVAAVVLFARAWVREFVYLMRLRDDAFPGHHDKLIWAMLLIVLPPVGAWMFGTYREAHWPEAKPGKAADAFDF